MTLARACAHCAHSGDAYSSKNTTPGGRPWETNAQTEERKQIAYLMRCRPRALSAIERRVLEGLYALNDGTRRQRCNVVGADLDLTEDEVHGLTRDALEKIFYERPDRGRRRRA